MSFTITFPVDIGTFVITDTSVDLNNPNNLKGNLGSISCYQCVDDKEDDFIVIRRIQYGKQHKWMMCLPENYRVSELGESIFFTKEEAEKYQIQQLYKYSKKQRDRVIEKKIKERNTELEELYRLLKKYPTPELRHLIKDSCQLCSHRDENSTYYEIPVYLCRVCNEHNMFDYDFDRLRELFGE